MKVKELFYQLIDCDPEAEVDIFDLDKNQRYDNIETTYSQWGFTIGFSREKKEPEKILK